MAASASSSLSRSARSQRLLRPTHRIRVRLSGGWLLVGLCVCDVRFSVLTSRWAFLGWGRRTGCGMPRGRHHCDFVGKLTTLRTWWCSYPLLFPFGTKIVEGSHGQSLGSPARVLVSSPETGDLPSQILFGEPFRVPGVWRAMVPTWYSPRLTEFSSAASTDIRLPYSCSHLLTRCYLALFRGNRGL